VEESKADADDERPPICPACGVTMGIIVDEDGATRYACLECGFSDELTLLSVSDDRPTDIEG
jgi:ribosomal protein S27AE